MAKSSGSDIKSLEEPINIVLLAGQSNMEGAGNYDELPADVKDRIKRISHRVQYAFRDEVAKPLSYKVSEYHKEKYGAYKTFGPEMFIGLTLAETYPNKRFLLIKTAYGGTSLYGAWNPTWTKANALQAEKGFKQDLPLFSIFSNNIETQLNLLTKNKSSYNIIGMAWLQGENDAGKEFSALSYQQNLINLINAYRQKFNFKTFVIGQINSTYGRFKQGPKIVREAMQNIADKDEYVEIINTSTDPLWLDYPKHDNVHYNTDGQIKLGKSFAIKLLAHN